MPFACSICEEESTGICVRCTKDTCSNHLCERCGCCSDCCGCEVPLDDHNAEHDAGHRAAPVSPVHAEGPKPDPEPEPPHPPPDPDPFPGDEPGPEPGPIVI